jgi:RNA polymerase sigma-70 factor (ECF subfamily)
MDSEQLGRLVDTHAAALELYARQWCDAPADVVQDAFVKLVVASPPPRDTVAWLYRVVRNASINASVAARRRHRHESAAGVAAPSWFEPNPSGPPGESIDPDSAMTELQSLPIQEREVIVARVWGGLTFDQIAGLAGCSTSTAHRLYESGLSALRQRLGATCRRTSRPNPS